MACSTGCPTPGAHKTWGECVRDKGTKIAYCGQGGGDATTQKRWDANLQSYRDAVRQGVQPKSTRKRDIESAIRAADKAA